MINPYGKGDQVLPPEGRKYLNRAQQTPGMIVQDDATYHAFVKRGWTWGSSWTTLQDYQHLEKKIK